MADSTGSAPERSPVPSPVAEAPAPIEAPADLDGGWADPGPPDDAPTMEERVEVGSTIERTKTGWIAKLHYGGQVRLFGEGPTMDEAVRRAGR